MILCWSQITNLVPKVESMTKLRFASKLLTGTLRQAQCDSIFNSFGQSELAKDF
mgnify:CR=1 FL=1